jgi:hypothetical protein
MPTLRSGNTCFALHRAVEEIHVGEVQDLLARGHDPNACRGQTGTPLHMALLMLRGCDSDDSDMGMDRITIAGHLLRAGAVLDIHDADGRTPFSIFLWLASFGVHTEPLENHTAFWLRRTTSHISLYEEVVRAICHRQWDATNDGCDCMLALTIDAELYDLSRVLLSCGAPPAIRFCSVAEFNHSQESERGVRILARGAFLEMTPWHWAAMLRVPEAICLNSHPLAASNCPPGEYQRLQELCRRGDDLPMLTDNHWMSACSSIARSSLFWRKETSQLLTDIYRGWSCKTHPLYPPAVRSAIQLVIACHQRFPFSQLPLEMVLHILSFCFYQ